MNPLGPFKNDMPLMLISYPNGGWTIVQQATEMGRMSKDLGAFTTAGEMLDALRAALAADIPATRPENN